MSLSIQKNVKISSLTTFRVGGLAKYFFKANNKEELKNVIDWAKKRDIPYFILGEGSNILASSQGFSGILIKLPSNDIRMKKTGRIFRTIEVDAGVLLGRLVSFCLEQGLSGLEYFVGIPGTIGGAVYGNAGWPRDQKSIGNSVISVSLLMPNGQIIKKQADWFDFVYRSSKLKNLNSKKIIILSVEFKLKAEDQNKILQTQKEILDIRKNGIPRGHSAGCIFKNIEINKNQLLSHSLKKQLPYSFVKRGTIPAGWLIDQCGLRGYKLGGAQISGQHANFIININKAKSQDIKSLIGITQKQVKEKFNINLFLEIEYLS